MTVSVERVLRTYFVPKVSGRAGSGWREGHQLPEPLRRPWGMDPLWQLSSPLDFGIRRFHGEGATYSLVLN